MLLLNKEYLIIIFLCSLGKKVVDFSESLGIRKEMIRWTNCIGKNITYWIIKSNSYIEFIVECHVISIITF